MPRLLSIPPTEIPEVPPGYCQCGCGRRTNVVKWTDTAKGLTKGVSRRFIRGHYTKSPVECLLNPETGCWEWQRARSTETGYGALRIDGVLISAHRHYYEIAFGPFDPKLCVLHRCDNRSCVNPAHLFLGTLADNNRDMSNKGRGRNGSAKLTREAVAEIRRFFKSGARQIDLAHQFSTTQSNISQIVNGHRWKRDLR